MIKINTERSRGTKRYFGKQTKKNRKQPLWRCVETGEEQTSLYWKQWAVLNGYIQEKFSNSREKFIIVNALKSPPITIKTLRRIR